MPQATLKNQRKRLFWIGSCLLFWVIAFHLIALSAHADTKPREGVERGLEHAMEPYLPLLRTLFSNGRVAIRSNNGMSETDLAPDRISRPDALMEILRAPNAGSLVATSIVHGELLSRHFPMLLLDAAQGNALFTSTLELIESKFIRLTLSSDLVGMQLRLPAPFGKPSETSIRFAASFDVSLSGANDQLMASLGSGLTVQAVVPRSPTPGTSLSPPLLHPVRMALGIVVPELDLGSLMTVLQTLRKYSAATRFDLKAGLLRIANKTLHNVAAKGVASKDGLSFNINSVQVIGDAIINTDARSLFGRFGICALPDDDSSGASAPAPSFDFHHVDVVCDRLMSRGRSLGRASVELIRSMADWQVKNFTLINPESALSARGWYRSATPTTSLQVSVNFGDAGKLLDRFGYPDNLRGGSGYLAGFLSWDGVPLIGGTAISAAKSGHLRVRAEALRLLEIESLSPSILRDTVGGVTRMLTHQISRGALGTTGKQLGELLFAKGELGTLDLECAISEGRLDLMSVEFRNDLVSYLISGQSDNLRETIDLLVTASPTLTGKAAYLRPRPVNHQGASVRVTDRLPLESIFSVDFRVHGTWADPILDSFQPHRQSNSRSPGELSPFTSCAAEALTHRSVTATVIRKCLRDVTREAPITVGADCINCLNYESEIEDLLHVRSRSVQEGLLDDSEASRAILAARTMEFADRFSALDAANRAHYRASSALVTARYLRDRGRLAQSAEYFALANEMLKGSAQKPAALLASVLGEAAMVKARLRNCVEAPDTANELLSSLSQLIGADHPDIAYAHLIAGEVAAECRQNEEAARQLALGVRLAQDTTNHGALHIVADALGRLLAKTNRRMEAADNFELSVDAAETLYLLSPPANQQAKSKFFSSQIDINKKLVDIYSQLHLANNQSVFSERAFVALGRIQSRKFSDMIRDSDTSKLLLNDEVRQMVIEHRRRLGQILLLSTLRVRENEKRPHDEVFSEYVHGAFLRASRTPRDETHFKSFMTRLDDLVAGSKGIDTYLLETLRQEVRRYEFTFSMLDAFSYARGSPEMLLFVASAVNEYLRQLQSPGMPLGPRELEIYGVKVWHLENARQELRNLEATMRSRIPLFLELTSPPSYGIGSIQRALRNGEVLLAYALLDEAVVRFRVTERELTMDRTDVRASQVVKLVRRVRKGIGEEGSGGLASLNPSDLHELYRTLIGESAGLGDAGKVIVIGDGALHTLPFEILLPELGPGTEQLFEQRRHAALRSQGPILGEYGVLRYFGESHRFVYLPSIPTFISLRTAREPPRVFERTLVAFGDPVFSAGGLEQGISPATASRLRAMTRALNRSFATLLPRLPESADEVWAIAQSLPGPHEIFVQEKAQEHVAKSSRLSGTKYIIFATHGLLAGDFGESPGQNSSDTAADGALATTRIRPQPTLALSLVGDLKGEDGLLTMDEILESLKLDAELVVLSACNTAGEVTDAANGEGFAGLTRAFMLAGARNLAVSHWPVESRVTTETMVSMFKRIASGMSPSEALSAAKQAILEIARKAFGVSDASSSVSHAHPFFWAPFVVVGD